MVNGRFVTVVINARGKSKNDGKKGGTMRNIGIMMCKEKIDREGSIYPKEKMNIIKEILKNRRYGIIKDEEENSKIFDNIKDLNKENLNIDDKEDIENIISNILYQK